MNRAFAAVLCVLITSASLAAATSQDRPAGAPQTTFKTAVDLVPVDVNVIDRDGRPVDNLTASDFTLAVDGRPRKILSAEFVRASGQAAPPPAPSPYYASNANSGAGRLVMLVIDQGSISTGRTRAAIESATRFIKRLSPADRIGLFAIPGPGPQISFTSNHALIQAQLPKIVGHPPANAGLERVGVGEAARIDRGDQMALSNVADRECTGADRQVCMQELAVEARQVIADARVQAQASLVVLRGLMERLSENATPKTLVYLSEALVIDQDRSALAWMGPLATKGRIALHVLRIDAQAADASARRSPRRMEDVALAEEGLAMMAGLARGSLFRVVGNADNIFNRLALEMSGYYLLGFEPEPGDRDGKTHKIRIDVPARRGIEVRARTDFTVESPPVRTDEQALVETLRSPLIVSDIGLKVTAYTFRQADSQRLRVLIAAEIDRSRNPSGRVALGYTLTAADGRTVASQFDEQVKTPVRDGLQRFAAAAIVDGPGLYALKLAAIDDEQKRGSVEYSFKAQLTPAGQVRAGDLLIGDGSGDGATPAVTGDIADGEALNSYLEVYGDSPDVLSGASVAFEIAARENSGALDAVAGRFDEASTTSSRRVAEAILPIGLLPPGEYVARAVVTVSGRKVAQVVRPFRVLRPSTTASATARGRSRAKPASAFTSRIDPFQRSTVLTPQVVGFFLNRMGTANRGPLPPAAIDHAKAGRFDAAFDAAAGAGHALAAAFLQGLTLYARGELEAAAVKFREALRQDSEFFPAAFYLGACYAAGGRDREASAAWQTSLVTESDAPFVYTLLGDALLRQREIDRALEILNEASTRWPDDPQVQVRLAAALAMGSKPVEALRVLDPYLATHPDDGDRLFLALRVIYEAHTGGHPIGTPEEDRSRFARYAAAYAAVGGPQLPLVEQWKRFMERKPAP